MQYLAGDRSIATGAASSGKKLAKKILPGICYSNYKRFLSLILWGCEGGGMCLRELCVCVVISYPSFRDI